MSGPVEARLVGPLSIDRWLDTGDKLPGGGALNMAYHWSQVGIGHELVSRVAVEGSELFSAFLDRHGIGHSATFAVPGTACSIDVRIADDRQPVMDNFVPGVLADFRLTDAEADDVLSGTPAHFVLVDVVDHELARIADHADMAAAHLTGDFLSARHFTLERFGATLARLDVGFVGWPGSPADDGAEALADCAEAAGSMLVMTHGSQGVRIVDARTGRRSDTWFDVTPVDVAGTTVGCGDAFIAAFLAQWHRTGDVAASVDAGRELGAAATAWVRPLPDEAYALGV